MADAAGMKITFVKKILADGEPCPKCGDVETRLRASGHYDRIDEVLIADESDPDSAGMRLARTLDVSLAPFFVVEAGGQTTVYTVYLKFVREVLDPLAGRTGAEATDEAADILRANPDLDLI